MKSALQQNYEHNQRYLKNAITEQLEQIDDHLSDRELFIESQLSIVDILMGIIE